MRLILQEVVMNILKQHHSFLFFTDLEPDDIVSLMIFIQQVSAQAALSANPIKLTFVVGEGDASIKVMRMNKLLKMYRQTGLLENVDINVIQGFSDAYGTQKNFIKEGQELCSADEIAEVRGRGKSSNPEEVKSNALQAIEKFLTDNDNSLVISIKPMRELRAIYGRDKVKLANHVLALTGSYNLRADCWSQDKSVERELEKGLVNLMQAFKNTYFYETYSTTADNSISDKHAPDYFKLLTQASDGLFGSLKQLIENWKTHLLSDDRKRLPAILTSTKLAQAEVEIIMQALNKDCNQDTLKVVNEVLKKAMDACKTDDVLTKNFQSLSRVIGKWKSLTLASLQFVNADPGLLAVLTGECDENVSIQCADLDLQGYTILQSPKQNHNKTFVFLPGKDTTLIEYLDWRSEEKSKKVKPDALKIRQEQLFQAVVDTITQHGISLNSKTLSSTSKLAVDSLSKGVFVSASSQPQSYEMVAAVPKL